jgi:hypothetical protein
MARKPGLARELAIRHIEHTLPSLGLRVEPDHALMKMRRFAEDFAVALDAIDRDTRWTPDGKSAERARLVRETSEAFEKFYTPEREQKAGAVKHLLEKLRASVSDPPPADIGERVAIELRKQEIRASVRDLPLMDRELVYRNPNSTALVRAALEEVPVVKKTRDGGIVVEDLVRGEVAEEVVLDIAEQQDPETARMLRLVREIVGAEETVANTFRNELREAAPSTFQSAPRLVDVS